MKHNSVDGICIFCSYPLLKGYGNCYRFHQQIKGKVNLPTNYCVYEHVNYFRKLNKKC
jgi:hypothetical protein